MKNHYNDDFQNQAITHGIGPACILAGPGSGKTFIITNRIKYLINNLHVSPNKILVITFTKKTATEMKQRFCKLNNSSDVNVNFGTFHSIFYQFLKTFNSINSLKIIDYQTQIKLIEKVLSSSIYLKNNSNFLAVSYDEIISNISCYKYDNSKIPIAVSKSLFIQFIEEYEECKRADNLLDFDDILINTYELLRTNDEFRKTTANLFDYILIDEFQDINKIQYETIKLLLCNHNNLFVVGDDDQSIYGFRGSYGYIFNTFIDDFPECKIINLINNYRSGNNIIKASSKLIKNNSMRIKNTDYMGNPNINDVFVVKRFTSKNDEYTFLKQIYDQSKKNNKTLGILVRTNKDVNEIIDFLNLNNTKTKSDIYNKIVLDIKAYLSFIYSCDRFSLYRIIKAPNLMIPRDIFLEDVIDLNHVISKFRGTYIGNKVEILKRQLDFMKTTTPYGFMIYLYNILGYKEHINKTYISGDKTKASKIYEELIEESKKYASLINFHDSLNLLSGNSKNDINNVLTFHASKGLEFDKVILPNVNEGHIPGREALLSGGSVDEERRLFYVAMTRAKEELIIAYIQEEDSKKLMPSRFINELN